MNFFYDITTAIRCFICNGSGKSQNSCLGGSCGVCQGCGYVKYCSCYLDFLNSGSPKCSDCDDLGHVDLDLSDLGKEWLKDKELKDKEEMVESKGVLNKSKREYEYFQQFYGEE